MSPEPRHKKTVLAKTNEVTPQVHSRSIFLHSRTVFYLCEQHGLLTDCILTEELTMHKMIPTDFVLTLPNILGHKCTCIKSRDQSGLIPPRVRREFLISEKIAEKIVGYARKVIPAHTINSPVAGHFLQRL